MTNPAYIEHSWKHWIQHQRQKLEMRINKQRMHQLMVDQEHNDNPDDTPFYHIFDLQFIRPND